MIETSSVHPRKSSEIFGNLRKISENVRKRSPYLRNNFGESSEIFGKWSEIFGKSSKTSSLVCLCNKQNITCSLVDMNFIFPCSTRHLTRSLRSLVRYRVEHSKIKFISTRGHVISSISCPLGTTRRVPQEKFPRKPHNKSFIDQAFWLVIFLCVYGPRLCLGP